METKTRIETYSHAETLLAKLFQAPRETFLTELKKAADIYFDPANDNDPREEKEIRRNIEALYKQGIFRSETEKVLNRYIYITLVDKYPLFIYR